MTIIHTEFDLSGPAKLEIYLCNKTNVYYYKIVDMDTEQILVIKQFDKSVNKDLAITKAKAHFYEILEGEIDE